MKKILIVLAIVFAITMIGCNKPLIPNKVNGGVILSKTEYKLAGSSKFYVRNKGNVYKVYIDKPLADVYNVGDTLK